MLSIESKKSKRVSVVLLVFCMILFSSHLYIRHEVTGFLIVQYSCWILSGISLAFTRRMDSIKVKWLVIALHFLLTCGVGLIYIIGWIIGWISLPRWELLLVCVLYFGAVVTLDYQKRKNILPVRSRSTDADIDQFAYWDPLLVGFPFKYY
ncbi:hypothetical protein NI447_02705 [Enterococcus lactis]|nr:hypothetical protein [Enterococcus lactis]